MFSIHTVYFLVCAVPGGVQLICDVGLNTTQSVTTRPLPSPLPLAAPQDPCLGGSTGRHGYIGMESKKTRYKWTWTRSDGRSPEHDTGRRGGVH